MSSAAQKQHFNIKSPTERNLIEIPLFKYHSFKAEFWPL